MFRAEGDLLMGVGRKPKPTTKKETSTSLPKSISLLSISKLSSDDKQSVGIQDSKQKLVRSISMYGDPKINPSSPFDLSTSQNDVDRLSTSAPVINLGIPSPNSSSPNSLVPSPYSSPGSSLSGSPNSIDYPTKPIRRTDIRPIIPETIKELDTKKETYDIFLDKLMTCPAVNMQIQQFVKNFEQNMPHPDDQCELIQNFVEKMKKVMSKSGYWSKQISEQTSQNLLDYITRLLYNKIFYSCQDDVKRDEKLTIKIKMLEFVQPKHLEVTSTLEDLQTCISELKKINYYCTVEDKMKCIVQCCKEVISVLGKKVEEGIVSADSMIPNLAILVLKAQVPYLVTNLNYVIRFSTSHKYSENFYYLTQVLSVVYFVEGLDAGSLTIDPQEFESGINAAKEGLKNSKVLMEKPLLKLTKKEAQLQSLGSADIATLIDSHWYY